MRTTIMLMALLCFSTSFCQNNIDLSAADKIRIREAMDLSKNYSGRLYAGMETTPFAVLLITDSLEYLMHHPSPTAGFVKIGYDSLIQSDIYYRKRKLQTGFLATFPAVGGINCVVVGTPKNTGRNSSQWTITLLHEHFHQYQYSQPGYYAGVDSLDLSGGDQTGMWMLNYAFPYDDEKVKTQFKKYSQALYDAVVAAEGNDFTAKLSNYHRERKAFDALLSAKDARYFYFQLWQEGLARHAEYSLLAVLQDYQPPASFQALPDYVSFSKLAKEIKDNELKNLQIQNLAENKRVSFYSLGFAEGLLLDRQDANWRTRYLSSKYSLPEAMQVK